MYPRGCMARRFVVLVFAMFVGCSGPTDGQSSMAAPGGQQNGGGLQGDEPGADAARADDVPVAASDAGARPDATVVAVAHPPGASGCGFAAAAFCDTFDAPSVVHGRAGELDAARWSAGHLAPMSPTSPTSKGNAFPVGGAMIPTCRSALPSLAFPDSDTLICDPSADVAATICSSRWLHRTTVSTRTAFGSPSTLLDGREIAFDAEGYTTLGWISLEVTEDPIADPSYSLFVNDEGGILPRNRFELQFSSTCGQGGVPTKFTMRGLHVFTNYADSVHSPSNPVCVGVQQGKLNHFEVSVSQKRIEVSVSPFSADGVKFAAPEVMYGADVDLPFSRGYVHVTVHNHATLKYSTGTWAGNAGATNLDAWVARWDNVGFDGPIVAGAREYEIPDSLTATKDLNDDPNNPTRAAVNLGYVAPDVSIGPASVLHFPGVDLDKVTSAHLALSSYLPGGKFEEYVLRYRLNGKAWRDRLLSPDEIKTLTNPIVTGSGGTPGSLGVVGLMIDVSLADLVAGDNSLEFVTVHVPQNYPPAIANVDLLLSE